MKMMMVGDIGRRAGRNVQAPLPWYHRSKNGQQKDRHVIDKDVFLLAETTVSREFSLPLISDSSDSADQGQPTLTIPFPIRQFLPLEFSQPEQLNLTTGKTGIFSFIDFLTTKRTTEMITWRLVTAIG